MTSPNSPSEVDRTVEGQREWAIRAGLELSANKKGFSDPMGGLLRGELYSETRRELEDGVGRELNRIHSLRSSTALSLNVFEPWRFHPSPIAEVLGSVADAMSFEAKQPTGLGGESPHLDVLLTGKEVPVGVEAKFLEPYTKKTGSFRDSYFENASLWGSLRECKRLAERIASDREVFNWLEADQLIKHALGLSKNHPEGFRLVLVWYRIEGRTAHRIEEEIGRFVRAVSSDIDFSAITYQELITNLSTAPDPVPGYFDYLADRYRIEPGPRPELPLITMGAAESVGRRKLDETIQSLDVDELGRTFNRTVGMSPQRPLRDLRFLVGHDGRGSASKLMSEKVVAKAIFNTGSPINVGGKSVSVVDYEVPLAARQGDKGVGDIDLLGFEPESGQPWIIELKVFPNDETPLKAFYQAVRYSAMIDANRKALEEDFQGHLGIRNLVWPAVLLLAADRPYWEALRAVPEAGAWRKALGDLEERVTTALGLQFHLVDLGDLEVELIDGAAHLTCDLHCEVV